MPFLSSADLDRLWSRLECERGDTLRVLCEYRRGKGAPEDRAPLLEIRDAEASRIKLLLSDKPRMTGKEASSVGGFERSDKEEDNKPDKYREAWSKVLVASFLANPTMDSAVFSQLLKGRHALTLYFDTSALASGVAHWMLEVFEGRVHFETSVLVDRELMRWTERGGSDFYMATHIPNFHMRTQWRLARQLLSSSLDASMITRPSPEQSALMLAKFRDESGDKSPDADMLLLEQARRQIAAQPRNARTIFLTGDRSLANTAAGIMGTDAVLYAVAEPRHIRPFEGTHRLRGWWEEGGRVGRLHVPSWGRFVRALLTACHRLVFERYRSGKMEAVWTLCQCWHHGVGVPSDWSDPTFLLEQEAIPNPATPQGVGVTVLGAPLTDRVVEQVPAAVNPAAAETAPVVVPPDSSLKQVVAGSKPLQAPTDGITPWADVAYGSLGMASWRLSAQSFMEGLEALAVRGDAGPVMEAAGYAMRRAYKVFEVLGWMTEEGRPGAHHGWLVEAWRRGDLDALHDVLLRLKVYYEAREAVKGGELSVLHKAWAGILRALGQASELEGVWYVGDRVLDVETLDKALRAWMPKRGDELAVGEVAARALRELGVSPRRLNEVMARLRAAPQAAMWHMPTEGTFGDGPKERVVGLREGGYIWEDVDPNGLTFGGLKPIRTIRRIA